VTLAHPGQGWRMDVLEVWRKSRAGRCACTQCFYCDRPRDVHQHDHYPVPRRAGGSSVVAACLVCLDLKDSVTLYKWDLEAAFTAIEGVFGNVPESIQRLPPEEIFSQCYLDIEGRWGDLPPIARVMYAKLRSIYEDYVQMKAESHAGGIPGT